MAMFCQLLASARRCHMINSNSKHNIGQSTKMASGGFQRERETEEGGRSTGAKVLTGLGVLGAVGLAGYALYKFLGEETEEKTEKPCQSQSSKGNIDESYKKSKCVLCNDRIIDNAKRLTCGHVIHTDCLRSLIINGSSRCPLPACFSKLTDEDLYCINKAGINNRANQLNPNHPQSGPGRPAGYSGTGDKHDLDNHSNQLKPNNENFHCERRSRKYTTQH